MNSLTSPLELIPIRTGTETPPKSIFVAGLSRFFRPQRKIQRQVTRNWCKIIQLLDFNYDIPVITAYLPSLCSCRVRRLTNGSFLFNSDVSSARRLVSDWSMPLRERHPARPGSRPLHRRHGNGRKHSELFHWKKQPRYVCWIINTVHFSPVRINFLSHDEASSLMDIGTNILKQNNHFIPSLNKTPWKWNYV